MERRLMIVPKRELERKFGGARYIPSRYEIFISVIKRGGMEERKSYWSSRSPKSEITDIPQTVRCLLIPNRFCLLSTKKNTHSYFHCVKYLLDSSLKQRITYSHRLVCITKGFSFVITKHSINPAESEPLSIHKGGISEYQEPWGNVNTASSAANPFSGNRCQRRPPSQQKPSTLVNKGEAHT
ncbi:hypothetical protein CEXT_61151 [Caerostris extrusa]|uniref:Uncharacterized protein n=1 Tax=Caerostris extrusa TaxID=172846 RepID=A0AAV4SJ83_CAEEX|nr:hypothetical protein CEXT_61151 [Caerostris extrusa]